MQNAPSLKQYRNVDYLREPKHFLDSFSLIKENKKPMIETTPQHRPLMLAVVGDSAAGKTTLTQGLATLMGVSEATLVCTDDYHKYSRNQRRGLNVTALHPDSNYLDIVSQHLSLMRVGQPVLKPIYNHRTGLLEAPEYVTPGELVIVEGLLALVTPAMQRCFDVTIYLDPEEDLRRQWKLNRDTVERGYQPEDVLTSLERRLPDSQSFIQPQKDAADLVIRFYRSKAQTKLDHAHLNVRLVQHHTLPSPDLSEVLAQSNNGQRPSLRLEKDVWTNKGPVDILEIDGDISREKARALEEQLWRQLTLSGHFRPENIGSYREGGAEHHSSPLALTQLLIAYYLLTVRAHRPVNLT